MGCPATGPSWAAAKSTRSSQTRFTPAASVTRRRPTMVSTRPSLIPSDGTLCRSPSAEPCQQGREAACFGGGRHSAPEAQSQPEGDQCKDGDAEIVVDTREVGIGRGYWLSLLRRLHERGHAFAKDELHENQRRDQPMQSDLKGRVAADWAKSVPSNSHVQFLSVRRSIRLRRYRSQRCPISQPLMFLQIIAAAAGYRLC